MQRIPGRHASRTAACFLATALALGGTSSAAPQALPVPGPIPVPKDTPAAKAGHILRRMTYGPTIADLAQLSVNQPTSIDLYIQQQLAPGTILETHPDLPVLLSQITIPTGQTGPWSIDDLARYQLVLATYSQKQLQEVLLYFWERHFNTYFVTVRNWFPANGNDLGVYFECKENAAFRANAVGIFENLLVASATSPAMLIYLDSVNNVAGAPNENYARELLELHTLGVDPVTGAPNLYTPTDIVEVARCFTGWTLCQVSNPNNPHDACGSGTLWGFHFDPNTHDYGAKTIFAGTAYQLDIPARPPLSPQGINDGYDVLSHLANMDLTADFVVGKLLQYFIGDEAAVPTLRTNAVNAWLSTPGGDVRLAMEKILTSKAFQGTNHRWSRVEMPIVSLTSTVRALDGRAQTIQQLDSMWNALKGDLSQRLFYYPAPDGFPVESVEQPSTSKYLERLKFVKDVYDGGLTNPPYQNEFAYDNVGLLVQAGVPLTSADKIVDFFLATLFQGNANKIDTQLAVDFLNTDLSGNPVPLNPAAPDYADRINHLVTFVSSIPQAFEQ